MADQHDPFIRSMDDDFNIMFSNLSMEGFLEGYQPGGISYNLRVSLIIKDIYTVTPMQAKKLSDFLIATASKREIPPPLTAEEMAGSILKHVGNLGIKLSNDPDIPMDEIIGSRESIRAAREKRLGIATGEDVKPHPCTP